MERNYKTPTLDEVLRHPGWAQNIVGGLMVAIFFILLCFAERAVSTDPESIKQTISNTGDSPNYR